MPETTLTTTATPAPTDTATRVALQNAVSPTRPDHRPRPAAAQPHQCPQTAPVGERPVACRACAHPPCRAQRAAGQSRQRGRTAEFAVEHHTVATLQARYPHLVIWFGEATQSYWAATSTGLVEAANPDALLLTLWPSASHSRHGELGGLGQE
ncbi:hypothetical protein [Salinactinospora qingdaonensis]